MHRPQYYDTRRMATTPAWFREVMKGIPEGKYAEYPWLIPGGADINPALYGEEVTFTHWFDPAIDYREFHIARLLLKHRVPVLGVCRGHQIITAAAGGTLFQDMYLDGAVISGNHKHHQVDVMGGSFLAKIFCAEKDYRGSIAHGGKLRANSLHHQATKDVPPGWEVVALAGRVIEAIQHPGRPEVISVQWHPEMLGQFDTIMGYLDQFTRGHKEVVQ